MHSGGSSTPNAAMPQPTDPRRPPQHPSTPLHYPMSPTQAGSSASGSVRVDRLGRVALRLEGHESSFHVTAFRGATANQHVDGDAVLARTLATGSSREVALTMDATELSLVDWQMRQGARVVQWAKLAGTSEGEAKKRWVGVKTLSHEFGKVSHYITGNLSAPLTSEDLGRVHRATSSRRHGHRSLRTDSNVVREPRTRVTRLGFWSRTWSVVQPSSGRCCPHRTRATTFIRSTTRSTEPGSA